MMRASLATDCSVKEAPMRGRKTSLHVVLTAQERDQLERRLRCTTTSLGLARRSRAVLGVADGLPLVEVARLVDLDREACAQVGPAIPEGSSRRVARSSRARPQAGLFPPR